MDIHVADHQSLPDGWKRDASLSFTVEGAAKSDDEDEATIKA